MAENEIDDRVNEYNEYIYQKASKFDQIMKSATTHHSNVLRVEIVKVIKAVSVLGLGIEASPVRQVTEYFTLDGERIARKDPVVDAL